MKSRKEEIKIRHKFTKVKKVTNPKDDNIKNIQVPQTLAEKLSRIEKLILELDKLKRTKNLSQIKNIDLIKLLRGTQYSTKIEQFFEFDLTIKKLKECFGNLQCSYPDCEYQAVMALEGRSEEPTIQYCDYHFNHSNNSTESLKIFEYELKLLRILFDEIEVQLVYIQERMDYIKSDKNQKNMSMYIKIEKEIQIKLKDINSSLKTMTERIYQIEEINKKKVKNKKSKMNFNDFSFVRDNLNECRESILSILSLISGPSSKNQAVYLIQTMMDFNNKIDIEEKIKDIPSTSVPHEIYNNDYNMVNFPVQSLQSIQDFEQKINTIFEYFETFQKSAQELMESYSLIKQVLIEQQNKKELIESEEAKEQKKSQDQLLIKKKDKNEIKINQEIDNNLQKFKCIVSGCISSIKSGAIYCPLSNEHFICNECVPMYIDIIFLDPRDNIPAKCGVCKELIDYDVIKKVLREEQLKEYDKYILVSKMTETQTLISCPHCTYFEICEIEQKPVFFLCKNEDCGMCTCNVCNESFALSKSVADLTEEQKKELMLEEGLPAHMECSGYRKYLEEIIDICEKQGQRLCPYCGFVGRKDCETHITCNNCKKKYCYACGLSFEVADKENPNGTNFEHNVNWETNDKRCPLFLYKIKWIDSRWPSEDSDCVDFLNKILTYTALRPYINKIGRNTFTRIYGMFESIQSYGIDDLDEILTMDLTLIHRRQR